MFGGFYDYIFQLSNTIGLIQEWTNFSAVRSDSEDDFD